MLKKTESISIEEILELAMIELKCEQRHLKWHSWPHLFPSTAGPRAGKGVIAGQAFTEFQVYAFENEYTGEKLKYCHGIWKEWSGAIEDRW